MNWTTFKAWLLARASEKSTWTGLVALIVAVTGHAFAPDAAQQIDMACGAIAAAVLVFTKSQGTTNSPWAVGVIAVLFASVLLAGCDKAVSVGTSTASGGTNAGAQTGVSAQAQTTANDINATYAVVKGIANAYVATCDGLTTTICKPDAVAAIKKALPIADAAVQQAVNAITNPTTDPTSIASLASDAMGAVQILSQVLVTFGVAAL